MHTKILNFRDLAGIPVTNGVVKPHKLLRGGPLENLDDQTRARLVDEFKLTHVIDLRTLNEQDRQPNEILDGVRYTHLDILGKRERTTADPMEMLKMVEDVNSVEHMQSLNDTFIRDEDARNEYRQFFKELLNNREGATYFHCSAGKDRTGFAAAQILKILGASRESILEDYLMTNILNKDNQKRMVALMLEQHPDATPEQIENYRGYTMVAESYIQAAFDAINEDYGDFDTYVAEVLELTADDIEILQTIYVTEQ